MNAVFGAPTTVAAPVVFGTQASQPTISSDLFGGGGAAATPAPAASTQGNGSANYSVMYDAAPVANATAATAGGSSPIAVWQAAQRKMLEEREAAAIAKRKELRARAQKDLADFAAERKKIIEGTKGSNRVTEHAQKEAREHVVTPGREWERVADLMDVSNNSASVGRMKSVLISLKNTPPRPMQTQ